MAITKGPKLVKPRNNKTIGNTQQLALKVAAIADTNELMFIFIGEIYLL